MARSKISDEPGKVKDLTGNPNNPRTITKEAKKALEKSLKEFGDLSGLVWNFQSNQLVAGHQRRDALVALKAGNIEWGLPYETDHGPERRGEIRLPDGRVFIIRGVTWPEPKEKAALVAANSPFLQGEFTGGLRNFLADLDGLEIVDDLRFDSLLDLLPDLPVDEPLGAEGVGAGEEDEGEEGDPEEEDEEEDPEDNEGGDSLGGGGSPVGNGYTQKVISPIYEPRGLKPAISELYDETKTQAMLSRISAAEIPRDIADFLRKAAGRYMVFDYGKIAEFYCHASPATQELMQDLSLVIVDFGKAIENGFVKLSDRLIALADIERERRLAGSAAVMSGLSEGNAEDQI